ncbi:hypothetical protein BKA61DRAFT_643473 [Leptodontidium sp. MPI-SDFR-AT-0119]|nr:hypothetical protein BKA61DRAFT_643473 [Leptodontidium sp. MPI-SDFR-AT-0119]
MEGVFSSAYCVIAASSAVNSEAGFLKRDVTSRYVPIRLLKAGLERTVDFLNSLFEGYSMRDLTQPTDRVAAIFGLQSRIESTLGCEGRYGVLKEFLHRNLLWQRHGTEKMERIAYNNLKVPSWSWMAYRGGIKFVDVSFAFSADIRWQIGLKFDGELNYALTGSLGKFWKCTVVRGETRYVVLDYRRTERGWLQFDVEDSTDLDLQKCVVVGRIGRKQEIKYFILVVRPIATNGEYERVGIGLIQESHVSKLEGAIRIV